MIQHGWVLWVLLGFFFSKLGLSRSEALLCFNCSAILKSSQLSRFQVSRIEPCRLCGSLSHFAQVNVCQHGTFDITQADHILLGPSCMGGAFLVLYIIHMW